MKTTTPETILEELLPCVNCGINADPADGFGRCTCGNEAKRKEILKQIESYHQNLYLGRLPEKKESYRNDNSSTDIVDRMRGNWDYEEGFNEAVSLMESAIKGRENESN